MLMGVGVGLTLLLLVVQIGAGLDLYTRLRQSAPGGPILGAIHIAGPIAALVVFVFMLANRRRPLLRRYGVACHTTFGIALVSWAIGMFARGA